MPGYPFTFRCALILAAAWLAGCAAPVPRPAARPATEVRSQLVLLMPSSVKDRNGWARDIQQSFAALGLESDKSHLCAALAVIAQESGFHADPVVPALARIAREEIMQRAAQHHVPAFAVNAALAITSPDGRSYGARLDAVRTERELSAIFQDLIGSIPLGRQLFADANPVRTGGPMQVSVAFAERFAKNHKYPWPQEATVRDAVFTRRGGLYFGIAHLLAWPVSYSYMRYRFADFNAGFYASRNAAFQYAVSLVSGRKLALDGDLVDYNGKGVGATASALLSLQGKLGLDANAIHDALERAQQHNFETTRLYVRVYELADARADKRLPRAMLPRIRLESPKISRKLTTAWFAKRVDGRYRACLRR